MRSKRYYYKLMVALGLLLGTVGADPAIAMPQERENFQLAQQDRGLAGLCRAVVRPTWIWNARPSAGQESKIRALEPGKLVILDEMRGENGWIAIRHPARGFVDTNTLSDDPNMLTEPMNDKCAFSRSEIVNSRESACRQVAYRERNGLRIRVGPSADNFDPIASVFFGDRVWIVEKDKNMRDNDGREWVEVTAIQKGSGPRRPLDGWMSNGLLGESNLVYCP